MPSESMGKVVGVNGNMVSVEFDERVMQNEVAYAILGEDRLKCEVIRVRGNTADLQIFEDAKGMQIGDEVEFTGDLLSVELGPGLLTRVYDGLQNPLNDIAEKAGFFLKRGLYMPPLDHEQEWAFTPVASVGETVEPGSYLGKVPEGIFDHYICTPFAWTGSWEVTWLAEAGNYTIDTTIAKLKNERGDEREATMVQSWPVKLPIRAYDEKVIPREPLVTQMREIDSFFPVAKGGTFCTPGPFGSGKTVLQHALSKYSEADIVIVAACGERAGEVVEVLREFPHLEDPRTGKSLMDRTIIICNTSSMPVAAREASVYTAVTLAEYYRQLGLNVLMLADSTSRWAQALREMSGRLEEIPGEEAFPAYLESVIANFYERAGLVRLNNGKMASITIGGSVSPAGGNFEEPVTQATLKVVGCFLGLSYDRAHARRYPAIDPLDSWSKYQSVVDEDKLKLARGILRQGDEVDQMMKVVGEEGTSTDDFVVFMKSEFLDACYLQQNSFDKVDAGSPRERQQHVFGKICQVLETKFQFKDKGDARRKFNALRQLFIDWNYLPWESDEFAAKEQEIDQQLAEMNHA